PEAWRPDELTEFLPVNLAPGVTLACEGQNRIGPRVDPTIESPREMHAEEGECGVRNGVDHALDERLAGGHELVVLAPERDDAKWSDASRSSREDIREQTGTVDGASSGHVTAPRLDPGAGAVRDETLYWPLEADLGARAPHKIRQGEAHAREIDETGIGHVKRRNSPGVGFECPDFVTLEDVRTNP